MGGNLHQMKRNNWRVLQNWEEKNNKTVETYILSLYIMQQRF